MKKNAIIVLLFVAFLIQCTTTGPVVHQQEESIKFHPDFKAVYWYQKSAEVTALYLQAYNVATWRLEQMNAESGSEGKAVVLDLDETVVDNSPYQASTSKYEIAYPKGWTEWVQQAKADALPGAKEFLLKAVEMGFEPFYITNRIETEKEKTIENLKNLGIPFADAQHVLVKGKTNDKTARQNIVSETHEIVMFIGDNLGDFSEIFQGKANSLRKEEVEKQREQFGKKFIILPNPMYGEWEGASFGFDYSKPLKQKVKEQSDSLKTVVW